MDNTSNTLVPPPKTNAGDAYGHGWQQMKKFFLELLLVAFIYAIIEIPMGWPYRGGDWNDWQNWQEYMSFTDQLFPLLYWLLIAIPIEYGVYLFNLKAVRGEKPEFRDLIAGFNQFVHVILSRILVIGIVVMGLFLLIIPGIIFAIKLSLVPYLVMDKKLDAIEAVKASWRLTDGHGWTIFAMAILAIPIVIGGFIAFIVGVIVAIIWIQCAFASIYYGITGKPEDQAGQSPEVTV